MSCMILTVQDVAMTTTQFTRAVCFANCPPVDELFVPRRQALRMNWVVATAENDNRRLQMGWYADRAD